MEQNGLDTVFTYKTCSWFRNWKREGEEEEKEANMSENGH
jgi:hypothetical protein